MPDPTAAEWTLEADDFGGLVARHIVGRDDFAADGSHMSRDLVGHASVSAMVGYRNEKRDERRVDRGKCQPRRGSRQLVERSAITSLRRQADFLRSTLSCQLVCPRSLCSTTFRPDGS